MATFIKLSNGTTISSAVIGSVTPYYNIPVSDIIRNRLHNDGLPESEQKVLKDNPSIKLVDIHGTETAMRYESEEERDAELARIEAVLVPEISSRVVMLDGKLINPKHLAAVYVEMFRGDYRLVIKVAGIPPLIRYCTRGEERTIMNDIRAALGEEVFERVAQTNMVENAG